MIIYIHIIQVVLANVGSTWMLAHQTPIKTQPFDSAKSQAAELQKGPYSITVKQVDVD